MRNSFDAAGFVKDIGRELVRAFETARTATTSELVGDAMETPVRERLEQVLPQGIGVGSGCVIDTHGNTSRQLDVVLYEKGICPVFCVNNSPETTYYPCEGVLAVGEVKSAIDKEKLGDAFGKIASVKAMDRAFRVAWGEYVCGRPYGENSADSSYGFQRDYTDKGDILGFIVAGESRVTVAAPMAEYRRKTLLTTTSTRSTRLATTSSAPTSSCCSTARCSFGSLRTRNGRRLGIATVQADSTQGRLAASGHVVPGGIAV